MITQITELLFESNNKEFLGTQICEICTCMLSHESVLTIFGINLYNYNVSIIQILFLLNKYILTLKKMISNFIFENLTFLRMSQYKVSYWILVCQSSTILSSLSGSPHLCNGTHSASNIIIEEINI